MAWGHKNFAIDKTYAVCSPAFIRQKLGKHEIEKNVKIYGFVRRVKRPFKCNETTQTSKGSS